MIVFPNAKINLGLHVIRKRTDGYHELETIFYPTGITDILEVLPGNGNTVLNTTGIQLDSGPSDNLCIKAYQLLKKDFDLPVVEIHLHKIIPSGAGLGGGSSDAAQSLNVLNTIFNLGIETSRLEAYAAELGSDCAFFIRSVPAHATGRGEILEPVELSLRDYYIVIAVPQVHVATRDAYAGVVPRLPDINLKNLHHTPVNVWKNFLVNDFETTVFKKFPVIKEVKDLLYQEGAEYASMSGSGSAVFGLFRHKPAFESILCNCLIYIDEPGQHP